MNFLVEYDINIPPDYEAALLEDLLRRERARAAELVASSDFFQSVWIVAGRRARICICKANDAAELDRVFDSLPATKWNRMLVTPLVERPEGDALCIQP